MLSSDMQEYFSKFKVKDYAGHKKTVYSAHWNHMGNYLASASEDCCIKIWSLSENGNLDRLHDLKDHTGVVDEVIWHPDNPDVLASLSVDKTIRVWDLRATKKNIKTLQTKNSNLNLAWSPDGSTIAVTNNEDCVTFYDFKSLQQFKIIKFEREVNEITWDLTGSIFLLTTSSESSTKGPITILDGKTLTYPGPLEVLDFHRGRCYCISLDPLGNYFATGAADSFVALWDISELVPVKTFSKQDKEIRKLSFSHDGRFIATAADDIKLDIYDLETGESIHSFKTETAQHTVAWNPKRYLLAYTLEEKDKDGPIHLFGLY